MSVQDMTSTGVRASEIHRRRMMDSLCSEQVKHDNVVTMDFG